MINNKEVIKILKPKATYVVAVSGGVDSVVLLDILANSCLPTTRLVVTHLNHGIRSISSETEAFVKEITAKYGLAFFSRQANLGANASEDLSRQHRYQFFREVQKEVGAEAIVVAHHQDDFLETVILNFCRGCHRRGLVSLQSRDRLLRPLLNYRKKDLIAYAQSQQLRWLEDESNLSDRYFRNRIRQKILPRLTEENRQKLLNHCQQLKTSNQELDAFLERYLKHKSYRQQGKVFSRRWFNGLNHLLACEVVSSWLFESQITTSQKQITYIVVKLKTLAAGKKIIVGTHHRINLTKRSLRLDL